MRKITLKDIFNRLAAGQNARKIRKDDPAIRADTITLARAWLVARFPDSYKKITGREPERSYKILVDENISPRVLPGLHGAFGGVTHTNFEKLTGKKDPSVWRQAVNEEYDAILTGDKNQSNPQKDLTAIAIEEARMIIRQAGKEGLDKISLDELPLIIHVNEPRNHANEIPRLLRKHAAEIQSYLDQRTVAYIMVDDKGVKSGPTYAKLIAEEENIPAPTRRSRIEAREQEWKKRIMAGKLQKELSTEERDYIDRIVHIAALLSVQEGISGGNPASPQKPVPLPP